MKVHEVHYMHDRTVHLIFQLFFTPDFTLIYAIILRSLQLLFAKIAKSHLSAQFSLEVFVLGWYTYFEAPQVLFSPLFPRKGGQHSENLLLNLLQLS